MSVVTKGTFSFIARDVQRDRKRTYFFAVCSPAFFLLFFFRKEETNFANASSLKTDSYLGSGLWSQNENSVADQQYRFYQINMSDMEAFQNHAFVRQHNVGCYGNSVPTERDKRIGWAFIPYSKYTPPTVSSSFVIRVR